MYKLESIKRRIKEYLGCKRLEKVLIAKGVSTELLNFAKSEAKAISKVSRIYSFHSMLLDFYVFIKLSDCTSVKGFREYIYAKYNY